MSNLLIADDDMIFIKGLANSILSKIPSVRLVKIATDGYEVYDCIKNDDIDFLLLDINMPKMSGMDVLKRLHNTKNLRKQPNVIIVSGELINLDKQIQLDYNIVGVFLKPVNPDNIVSRIRKFIEMDNIDELCNKYVTQELKKLSYNIKHNGTQYLKEVILYILQRKNDFLVDNLEKNVYSHIAKVHKKTVGNIKNNIVKATNNMYLECNINFLINYFNFEEDIKPTPKIVISTIVNKAIEYKNTNVSKSDIHV